LVAVKSISGSSTVWYIPKSHYRVIKRAEKTTTKKETSYGKPQNGDTIRVLKDIKCSGCQKPKTAGEEMIVKHVYPDLCDTSKDECAGYCIRDTNCKFICSKYFEIVKRKGE
jgi:hypothetical protein